MRKITFILTLLLSANMLSAQKNAKMENTTATKFNSTTDSTSYALGILVGKSLKNQGFEGLNLELFKKAIQQVMDNKPTEFTDMQAQTFVQKYQMEQQKVKAEKNSKEGQEFLEKNKTKKGVITTTSGLQYEVLKEGDGSAKPTATSQVTAHYHGTLLNGTVFDSSVQRNQPFKTGVGQVIPAWQEALQLMSPGTKLRIYCPSNLAYGERGAGGSIGPNQVLIFEMELISIDKP